MLNLLVIDDSSDFRSLLRVYLKKEIQDFNLTEYNPESVGRPDDDYDWSQYDVLFLDYNLGLNDEDGLEWLFTYRDKPGFPPAIMLTAEGDEYLAVKAIKLGAADYMNKVDMTPKLLAEKVADATAFSKRTVYQHENDLKDAENIIQKASVNEEMPDEGAEIGYRFVRMIGEGAMSRVFLAETIEDKKTVVIKILDLSRVRDAKLIRRFVREANFISAINSPFVVQVYDQGMTDEYGYIVMEFFSRGDLKHRVEFGLRPEIAIIYATHIAYGLEQIHNIELIHRDLKPANIMFRGDDSLALADFGISKKLDAVSEMTTQGQILGTPHYMSPEQGEGVELDKRTDLYSLGVILYEMLTGDKPFIAKTAASLIYQHITAPIPKLPKNLSQYQDVLDGLLAKKPADRISSASETIKILESLQD